MNFLMIIFMSKCFLNLCGKERYRQGIIQKFNLGVGSHVSITLNFAAEEGMRGAWGGP